VLLEGEVEEEEEEVDEDEGDRTVDFREVEPSSRSSSIVRTPAMSELWSGAMEGLTKTAE
jgi:ligand-binding sensor domain-containing protein